MEKHEVRDLVAILILFAIGGSFLFYSLYSFHKNKNHCNNLCNSARVIDCIGESENGQLFLAVCADTESKAKLVTEKLK